MIRKILIVLWLILLIFTRFYNLEKNFKFNRDESSDLVKIHQYWQDKKISLIGPISEDGNFIYSSLSYYLVMPACVLFGFKTVSPTIGTAFWSVVTGILMAVWLLKHKSSLLDWLLILVWYPLIVTGRWAWNPNLVTLWMIIGWLFVNSKYRLAQFFGGLSMGLTSHHHYLALTPAAIIGLFKQKINKVINIFLYLIGLSIPIGIFLLFDVTHKPGLFITRFFMYKSSQMGFNPDSIRVFGNYLFGEGYYLWMGIFLTLSLLIWEILNKKFNRWSCWVAIISLVFMVAFINRSEDHYFVGAIIPFWIWMSEKREKLGNILKSFLIVLLIFSSLQKSTTIVLGDTPDDSSYYAQKISDIIANDINKNSIVNPNLAVLRSSDVNSYGVKFRDLLLIKNIRPKTPDELNISDNLYVITQAKNIEELKKDASNQMQRFKNGPYELIGEMGNDWKLYRFNLY